VKGPTGIAKFAAVVAVAFTSGVGCLETATAVGCVARNDPGQCYRDDIGETERWARKNDGCERGDGTECVDVGRHIEDWDPVNAAKAYDRACSLGEGAGCGRESALIVSGRTWHVDRPRAFALAQRGCSLEDAASCAGAAELSPDRVEGDRLAETACELGGLACPRAGDAHMRADPERARELYLRGCRVSQRDACVSLGRLEAKAE
jgi:TPR repeat protein